MKKQYELSPYSGESHSNSQSQWMNEYFRSVRNSEVKSVKEMLDKWVQDIEEDIETCKLTMANLFENEHSIADVE